MLTSAGDVQLGSEKPLSRETVGVFHDPAVVAQHIHRSLRLAVAPLPPEVVQVGHGEAAVAVRGCCIVSYRMHHMYRKVSLG